MSLSNPKKRPKRSISEASKKKGKEKISSEANVEGVGPCGLNNLKRDRLRMQKKQQQSI